jgi:hypothetical protein
MATIHRRVLALSVALAGVVQSVGASEARGQGCEPQWLPSTGVAGAGGEVRQMHRWDPDGDGPLANRIVIEGEFIAVENVASSKLAWLDMQTRAWGSFGDQLAWGQITDVAVSSGNEIVIAGSFGTRDFVRRQLMRWDGSGWVAIANNPLVLNGFVQEVVGLSDGSLAMLATSSASAQVYRLHDGVWSELDGVVSFAGNPDNTSLTLLESPEGGFVLGGNFTGIGGQAVSGIARWDGAAWSSIGNLSSEDASRIRRVERLSDGSFVVAGEFTQVGGVATRSFARWNGEAWVALDSSFLFSTTSMTEDEQGRVVATGRLAPRSGFETGDVGIVRWDGQSWQVLSGDTAASRVGGEIRCAAVLPGGDLLIGGRFGNVGLTNALNLVTRREDGVWSAVGDGLWSEPWAIAQLPTGELLVGAQTGDLTVSSRPVVLRQEGRQWVQVGDLLRGNPGLLTVLPSGRTIVAGGFVIDTLAVRSGIAQLVGNRWESVGSGLQGTVNAVVELPNGDIVAGGFWKDGVDPMRSNVARWDGQSWQSMGQGLNARVLALKVISTGELVAVGGFTASGQTLLNGVARWDGADWRSMGNPRLGVPNSILSTPSGDLLVGGLPVSSGFDRPVLARFDGTQWESVAAPTVSLPTALAHDAAGAVFAGGMPMRQSREFGNDVVMRLVGSTWQRPGTGVRQEEPNNLTARINDLLALHDGTIAVAGKFAVADGRAAGFLAFWGLPPQCRCDSIDFNNDGIFPSDADLVDFLGVLAGGGCCAPACNDIDFNNDGLFPSDDDLIAFLRVLAGGACV